MKEINELHHEAKKTLARIETAQRCFKVMESVGGGLGSNQYEELMRLSFYDLIDMLSPNGVSIIFDIPERK